MKIIIWIVAFCCVGITAGNYTECDPLDNLDIKISIVSRRNKTGHLVAQVKLEEASDQVPNKKNSWQVDIDHDLTCSSSAPFISPIVVEKPDGRFYPLRSIHDTGNMEEKGKEPPGPHYTWAPKLGYYKLHTWARSWPEAKIVCETEGAHLAIINSQHELDVLKELRLRLPKLNGDWRDDTLYIGINDIQHENVWVTIFDEPLSRTGFNKWDVNQPDNGASGNCGTVRPSTGKLHDIACSAVLGFYCERGL